MSDFNEAPILRIQLERARYTLLNHLKGYEKAIEDTLEKQIHEALSPEALERMVGEAVRAELPSIIRSQIQTALGRIRWDMEVSDLLSDAIGKVLQDMKKKS